VELVGESASSSYTFMPNYLNKTLDPTTSNYYMLNAQGNSYKKLAAETATVPFRPYFQAALTSPSRRGNLAEELIFSDATGVNDYMELMPGSGDLTEGLNIYAKKGKIIVESYRQTEAFVRILTPGGLTLTVFPIAPGETIVTPIHATGIYIANGKKLRVEAR
jgi:hypothetical protein